MLAEGSSAGVIEHEEHQMIQNVFRLDDRQIASLMVPRSDVVYLDIEDPLEENIKQIETSEHSRFPVCSGKPGGNTRRRPGPGTSDADVAW